MVANSIPSTVVPLAKSLDKVPVVVVATLTDSLRLRPWISPSTYDFVVTWLSFVGADDEVIFVNVGLSSVPKPKLLAAPDGVVEPVPPNETGTVLAVITCPEIVK